MRRMASSDGPLARPDELGRQALDAAVAGQGLTSVFQPIVTLPDEVVVGYEALSRWNGGEGLYPTAVFAHAEESGHVERLDRLCIDTAIDTARTAVVGDGALLSINCEAGSDHAGLSADQVVDSRRGELQVMFELTERGLLVHPKALLHKVETLRANGFRIALDDVGAHPDSLALLDIVSPDVIKLDLRLVQDQPRYSQARTIAAVLAHVERTGAAVVAEGIETGAHLEQALALGAGFGQGYRFGRPAPLDHSPCAPWVSPDVSHPPRIVAGSPFDLVAAEAPVRTARKATLLAFSRQIESEVLHGAPAIVLTALQHGRYLDSATRARYEQLAETCPLVAVFGEQLPDDAGQGVRGVALTAPDPLCLEWTVIALGAHTAAALIARQHDDPGTPKPEADRRFDFVISYDRQLVTKAARNLLDRID
jgi:EAL domain-containing protein (putative c-di-GMP-specific phosphodiesterase class I)